MPHGNEKHGLKNVTVGVGRHPSPVVNSGYELPTENICGRKLSGVKKKNWAHMFAGATVHFRTNAVAMPQVHTSILPESPAHTTI